MAGWLGGSGGQSEAQARAESAIRNPVNTAPGFWEGAGDAASQGVMRGAANAARTAMIAGSVYPQVVDMLVRADGYSGKSLTQQYFEAIDPAITDAVDYWTPDPKTTGTAGRVLGGIAEFAVPLALGGGNPLATAITTSAQVTASTGADLAREGVSGAQAGGVAAVQGLANLVGVGVAMRGATALKRAAFGAGTNVAINAPADAASAAVLSGTDQADRYNPLSGEARAIDLVVGALFGAMARPGMPPKTGDVDAVLTMKQVDHAQHDRAQGRIADPVSARAQMDNMREAVNAIDNGTEPLLRPVAVQPDPVKARQAEESRAALESVTAEQAPALRDPESVTEGNAPLFDAPPAEDVKVRETLAKFADENPDFPVGLVDDPEVDGGKRQVTAREALDLLERETKADEELAGVFETAVNCFLRS